MFANNVVIFGLKTQIMEFYKVGGKYKISHNRFVTPPELVLSSLIKDDLNTAPRLSVLPAPVGLGIESRRV